MSKTRRLMVAAAERGFCNFSTSRIARAAGVSEATVRAFLRNNDTARGTAASAKIASVLGFTVGEHFADGSKRQTDGASVQG